MRTVTTKLNRIYLIASITLLVTTGLISQGYLYHHARTVAHDNLHTLAAALAGNLESAVAFGDAAFAQQTLNALQHYPDVRMAAVILPDGKLFAEYASLDDKPAGDFFREYLVQGDFMAIGHHGVTQTIVRQGESPARLALAASLGKLNQEMGLFLGVGMLLGGLLLFASYTLFRRMSKEITHPLEALSAVMQTVEREGDHGQRARIVSDDEISELTRGFNSMLDSLETQTSRLNKELCERKATEAVLRIAATAFESHEAMMVTDENSVIMRINKAFTEVTGYTAQDVVGQTPRLLQSGRHDAAFYRTMWESIHRTDGWHGEVWDRRKTGEIYPKWLTISAVKDRDGVVTNYIGTHFDISKQKRVEQELHELNADLENRINLRTRELTATVAMLEANKQKLQSIVDTALDAVIRVDVRGTIVGWNTQAELTFGWSAQEAVGQPLHETIIPARHREAHVLGMARYVATAESRVIDRRIEISALHQSGREFPIELAITRVRLADTMSYEFCAFIRDISQRKQAEDEIRTSLEKQKELNQLKSRFVAMTSHEFRTPLATIMSSADLLEHYFDRIPPSERTELFRTIPVAVNRMTRMLEDILLIGQGEAERLPFNPVQLSLDVFCTQLINTLHAEHESMGGVPHRVKLSIIGDATQGFFDEKLMRHIFGNLLSNAVKYSPDTDSVEFSVTCGDAFFVFTVADQGIGIPEADLPKLFESFHRASNVGNITGTGLGLAIVKRSVEMHSGSIAVSSRPGSGTVFTVSLPRNIAAPALPEQPPS